MLEISETFLDSRKPTELENSCLLGELYIDEHEVEDMGTNIIGIALSEKWHDYENMKFNTNIMTLVSDSHLSQELKAEATKNNRHSTKAYGILSGSRKSQLISKR